MFAQDYGNNAETLKVCSIVYSQTNSFSSNLDADSALDRILEVVGLSKNFVLAPCSDINNAVAVSFKGVRYILYDPDFMSMLSRNTSNWTNLFILAHEVGHHVNGHSLDLVLYDDEIVDAPELKKKREQELEADEFAGFILAKLGASLTQTTSSVSKLSNEDDTYSTHPKRDRRINSIKEGWNRGYSQNIQDDKEIINSPSLKEMIIYDWETKLTENKKVKSKNPFDNIAKSNKPSSILTSSIIASKFENQQDRWPTQLEDWNSREESPKLIIVQELWDSGFVDENIYIENLIDFEMFFRVKLKEQKKIERRCPLYSVRISIIIESTTYTALLGMPLDFIDIRGSSKTAIPSLFEEHLLELGEQAKQMVFENKVRLQLHSVKIKGYRSFKSQKEFINILKNANDLYFKLDPIAYCKHYFCENCINLPNGPLGPNEVEKDWFNTYFIDLKGSSKALFFKP